MKEVHVVALWLALASAVPAWAGSGPWVVGPGQATVYGGVESQRLTRLAIQAGGERDVIDVGQGVTTFGVKGIATIGISQRVEVEATLPWWRVRANRDDAELCGALGLDACETTTSVGILEARAKVLLVDELFGPPLSVAAGLSGRWGDFTAPTRARITNVGEGTVDVGPFVSVGRTGALGESGFFSAWADSRFLYRLPNTRSFPGAEGTGGLAVPGPELSAATEVLLGPSRGFAIGPAAQLLWRPTGLDWGELDLGDIDRLGALRVLSVRAGAQVLVRNQQGAALTMSAGRVVWAVNNPVDVWSVNVGMSVTGRPGRGGEADG